jgi:acyl-coenzyme A thioesterase PaaI-like protein
VDDLHSEGRLRLRHDLRHAGGLLAAPLAITVVDASAANSHAFGLAPPTRVDVNVYEPAHDVAELRALGRLLRVGRNQIFSEVRFEDASQPGRLIAYGMESMAVSGPPLLGDGSEWTEGPPEDSPELPPLPDVFEGVARDDGGYDITALTPRIGVRRLHSGTMQVLGEAAAMNTVRLTSGATTVRTEHLGSSFMIEGRIGPFSLVPRLVGMHGDIAGCAVDVRDHGAGNLLTAVISARIRVVG